MSLKIDHVTLAGPSLAELEADFTQVGLSPHYGGPHSNGITHMSLLGFEDGSYLELISALDQAQTETTFWGKHIADSGGPCAWAVSMDDVAAEARRVAGLAVKVDGPHSMHRRRPDGQVVEWELAFLGDKGAGAILPFIIKDITPRSLRVQPSAGMAGQPALLQGVSKVILGVKSLEKAMALFQRVYGWPAPQQKGRADFEAAIADFTDTPVMLATPRGDHSWLAKRLAYFDESPCAYLLATSDFEAACRHFNLVGQADWFGRPVAWFDPAALNRTRLGVIG